MPLSPDRDVTARAMPRLAVLVLVVVGLGLPINDLLRYAVLLIGSIAIFSSTIWLRPARWCTAIAVLAACVAGP